MTPVDDDQYRDLAGADLSATDLEALAANAEQDADMPQAIRHLLYIGWVLGAAQGARTLHHAGGNRIAVEGLAGVVLTVPYPPESWRP